MKYRRNFVRRSSRMTSYAGSSRYAGAISNAPVAGLNTILPQASVRSGAAQRTLTISGAIDVSATSPAFLRINPFNRWPISLAPKNFSRHVIFELHEFAQRTTPQHLDRTLVAFPE